MAPSAIRKRTQRSNKGVRNRESSFRSKHRSDAIIRDDAIMKLKHDGMSNSNSTESNTHDVSNESTDLVACRKQNPIGTLCSSPCRGLLFKAVKRTHVVTTDIFNYYKP